ncbi:flagellar hook-associated protein FlgK [Geomicrobium sp. JCM 19055]|uniref:flagellar hook-associated protein FlgK n=1 Tax=Geomicrobium sp. JCM 19055 TaxID=1460649 RepID=UPI00045EDB5D|nr:flagellar hook-associated protein FlgK [Geomicrobium sp. JCM 19055]GAJ97530.1 flagellar hook-associated protein FlgK [Geomicrobium sp. JCM 19055]
MTSTFHGLQTAYKGLMAQQRALQTTGHNIANANTPGYTRQRVNFNASQAFPAPGMNAPSIAGQIGTGVDVESVQRVRDEFLDLQYRGESSRAGYWAKMHEAHIRMEDIMNEPSDSGLGIVMDDFWRAIEVLADNPSDKSAREVVRQQGETLADTYNYIVDSLTSVQQELKHELDGTTKQVNTLLEQIHNLNEDINRLEPHGYLPNDLYDERDRLIDELSELIPIEVKYAENQPKDNRHPTALGPLEIHLKNSNGEESKILDADGVSKMTVHESAGVVESIRFEGNIEMDIPSQHGKVAALVESYGYITEEVDAEGNAIVQGVYPEMLDELQSMMEGFVTAFNQSHREGQGLNDSTPNNFFTFDQQNNRLGIDNAINNLDNIAASGSGVSGDGSNALALSNQIEQLQESYRAIVGEMAVATNNAARMDYTSGVRQSTIEQNRLSMSAVSLDEEMVNMISFQHAYNAAARQITMIDEMLDRIINGMGIVGR